MNDGRLPRPEPREHRSAQRNDTDTIHHTSCPLAATVALHDEPEVARLLALANGSASSVRRFIDAARQRQT